MAATYFLAMAVSNGGSVVAPGSLAGSALPAGVGLGVQAFSWGVAVPVQIATGAGLTASKASFSDLSVMTRGSASTPRLLLLAASGTSLAQVQLLAFDTIGGTMRETERYLLQGAFITSVQHSGSQGDGSASLALTFAYRSIRHTIFNHADLNRPAIVGDGGWDLIANRAL